MRIEFVTDTFPPDINGVAMTLGRLVDGLRSRGHLVHVFHTADRPAQPGETPLPSLTLPGYKEVRMGLPGRFKLFNHWKKKRPDVVYVATETPLGYSAVKAAQTLNIPVAAGFHTNFDQYLETYKLDSFKPAALAFLKKMHNTATCTFAPSPEVVDRLTKEGFEEVRLLGRGVDTKLFNPLKRNNALRASWGATEENLVCLFVGRVSTEKNIPLSIETFLEIKKKRPNAKMVVVGDGPEKDKLAAKYPEVIFAGMQIGDDLARHYASADLLLFASATETYGNVVMEALGSGIATLSYDYAAPGRFVQDSENGFKVPLGNADAYKLKGLYISQLKSLERVKEEARKTAEKLSWVQVITNFEVSLRNLSLSTINERNVSKRKPSTLCYRSIFISDIHLGGEDSKVKEVVDFLKHTTCETLYLNGDIIDGWALKRGSEWKKLHTRFVRAVLRKVEKEQVKVIYLRGNHDDVLDRFLPITFGTFKLEKEHIHIGVDGKKYLVVHGDGFDSISTNHKWLAFIGAIGYDLLLKLNRTYNKYRAWQGKEYYSISKQVKARVKSAVSFVDKYQDILREHARKKKCDGIICGHVHTPADEEIDGIRYLNSGDWVETLSAVVEHHSGKLEVIHYKDFVRELYKEEEKFKEFDDIEVITDTEENLG